MTLLYSATMSLDGYIAGPDGDMDWLSRVPPAVDLDLAAHVAGVGCLLTGGRTFRGQDPGAGTDSEGAFGGQYAGPQVVLSHRGYADLPAATEVVPDLEAAVDRARALAGDRRVEVLGAHVARSCLEAGLLDEILVFVAPVLLGDGTRLLAVPGGREVALEPTGRSAYWFRVVR